MNTIRVDGNDALAVLRASRLARKTILETGMPAFIEFMTYRIGDHSTSDHSVLYRSQTEIDFYKKHRNPITRLGIYYFKKYGHDYDIVRGQ